jgi:hypothetical protein
MSSIELVQVARRSLDCAAGESGNLVNQPKTGKPAGQLIGGPEEVQ